MMVKVLQNRQYVYIQYVSESTIIHTNIQGPTVYDDETSTVARIKGELLCFRPGDYTLVSDQDLSLRESELHLLLHFSCDGEMGIYTLYVHV